MTAPIYRIEPLQALRGLAAFLILAKHALYEIDTISPIVFNYGNYDNYVIGIDIFFVLSGFIMVYTSWGKSGLEASKTFMLRRIMRIVPIYWFYTILFALIALYLPQVLGNAEFLVSDFFKSLFFIPYINSVGDMQPLLAVGWTLNYEMFFYIVFAVCLVLPVRLSLIALSVFLMALVLTDFFGMEGNLADFYSRPIVLEFLIGSLIGYLYMKQVRLPAWFFWVGCVFTLVSIIALLYTDTLIELGVDYNKANISMIIVALLVLPKKAATYKLPKWSVVLGDASYSVYLSHPFSIGAVTQSFLLMGWVNVVHPWIIFALSVFVSLVGGVIAYYALEKPLLSVTKGLIKKEQKPAPQERLA